MDSVKATKDRLHAIERELVSEFENLKHKRELLDSSEVNEMLTVWMMDDWNSAESLKRKEKDLMIYRKARIDLEIKIVRLYQKSISMMSSKVSTMMKRLSSPEYNDPNVICPVDLCVAAYREWSKHSPKLINIQSEILELLTQKVKLAQDMVLKEEKVEIPRSFTNDSDKDGPMNFEKLRKRAYTMIQTAPHLDSSFSEFVSELVSPSSDTFEGRRTRDYVNSCWQYLDTRRSVIEENANFDASSPCAPDAYQMFLCAMTQFLVNRYSQLSSFVTADGVNPSDMVYKIVEANLFPQICECVYKTISCQAGDSLISKKYDMIGPITQGMLGIKQEHIKDEPNAYGKAISMLQSMALSSTPNQKLRRVILAAQYVMDEMNETCQEHNINAGADEFMDIWIYVILKAKVPDLASVVCLLRNYCNPSLMLSEAGYYISSLEFACEYIKSVKENDLPHCNKYVKGVKDVHKTKYVLLDTDKVTHLGKQETCPFIILEEDISLHGYETVLIVDWYNDEFRILQRFAYPNERVSTHACVIQPKFGIFKNTEHFESFLSSFKNESPLIQFHDTDHGKIPMLNNKCVIENGYELMRVPQWTSKSLQKKLQYLCNLKGLGSTCRSKKESDDDDIAGVTVRSESGSLHVVDSSNIELLCSQYETVFSTDFQIDLGSSMVDVAHRIIVDVQDMLKTLGFFSSFFQHNGLYDSCLTKSAAEFQKIYNTHQQTMDTLLNEEGTCNYRTYSSIRNSIKLLSSQCMASF